MDSKQLLALCQKHPGFGREVFVAEGRKMRDLKVLDDFYALCDKFFGKLGSKPGSENRCNSRIAWWSGMTTKEPDGEFEPASEKMVYARKSPPDVDMDFDYFRRGEIYQHLVSVYGPEYTCNIGTHNKLKVAATLRAVGKSMDIGGDWSPGVKTGEQTMRAVNGIAKLVPDMVKNLAEARKLSPDLDAALAKMPEFADVCEHIQGRVSHGGVHAAGIIVSKRPISDMVPLWVSREAVCSQFDKDEMEGLGLLKYDILALKTLSVVETTLQMIRERHGKQIDVDRLEPTDPKVFKLLNDGLTKGIFQMESFRFTQMMQAIRVDSFDDMVACNAIYRPGPLGAHVDVLYADLKHGRTPVMYDDPVLEPILRKTYGMIVYQEQVSKIAKALSGATTTEADGLRKFIGKKETDKVEELKKMKDRFVNGCVSRGVDIVVAENIWQKISFFGGYGFNLSHAACYAYIAYQTAWLKCYYPREFMCSLLSSEIGDEVQTNLYSAESRKMGIKVYGPDVNASKDKFVIEVDGNFRAPLHSVKGVGERAVKKIIDGQPYKTMREFVEKNDAREVTSKIIQLLVDADALAPFGSDKEALKKQYEALRNETRKNKVDQRRFSGGNTGFLDLIP